MNCVDELYRLFLRDMKAGAESNLGEIDGARLVWYFPFAWFETIMRLDRELIRGVLRSMRGQGWVEYGRGWSEDQEIIGSGYTLTAAGVTRLAELDAMAAGERAKP